MISRAAFILGRQNITWSQLGLYTQIRGQSRFFHGSLLAKVTGFRHFVSALVPRDSFP